LSTGRLRDQYDWVVLGDHPGALLSASLAARLGLSVLVLPFEASSKLLVSASGQHFDPEPNLLLGLASSDQPSGVAMGLLGTCLKRLGILPTEEELIHTEGCLPNVVTPSARLGLAPNNEDFAFELKRELGEQSVERLGLLSAITASRSELHRYWLALPSRLTVEPGGKRKGAAPEQLPQVFRRLGSTVRSNHRAAQAWLSRGHRISDLLRIHPELDLDDICRGLWHSVASASTHDPELQDVIQVLALANSAAGFRGGMSAYREFMLRLARRAGADIPIKTDCRRVFVEAGRLVGIQVSNHGNMIATPAGILGCSLGHAAQKMTSSGRTLFRRVRGGPRPVGWRMTIALTVRGEAIPAKTPSRLVWQERDAPSLQIEIVTPDDFGHKEPDHRIIFARAIVPFSPESLTRPYQRMITARMFRQLTEIFPFLEFHVRRVFPDFRAAKESVASLGGGPAGQTASVGHDEFAEAYPYTAPAEIPENLRCYSGRGLGARSGIEGLFVSSGESFPELGTLGPTVAAVESVAWLAHRSGLPGPFV
jgi:hypothetical protein